MRIFSLVCMGGEPNRLPFLFGKAGAPCTPSTARTGVPVTSMISPPSTAGSYPSGSMPFTTNPASRTPRSLHDRAAIAERPRAPILLVVTMMAGISRSLIRSAIK